MTKYICKKCNYKFESEKELTRCPYCSSEFTLSKPMDAQDLIDSSDNLMDDD